MEPREVNAVDARTFAMGALVTVGAHVVVPALLFFGIGILKASGLLSANETEVPQEERKVIEARFLQKGIKFDPRKLPNRRVPRLSTAPRNPSAFSKNVQEWPPDAGQRPPDAVEDAITRLGDRAQAFAEIAEEREREGDPDGIEEGTERDRARVGDLYAGKLYLFFRRGWDVPTLLSESEVAGLIAEVDVEITMDLRVGRFSLRRPSGNALFDQSVMDHLSALRDSRTELPAPPTEVASDFLGKTLGVRFSGRAN